MMQNKGKNTIIFFVIGIFMLMLVKPVLTYLSSDTIEITISNKDRITTGSGKNIDSKYLIYTENEVFENTDALLFGKFDSSDLQNKLKVDSTYKVKVAGWRIAFFSSYRNIIEIK